MQAIGAIVHFTPDASRRWDCRPAMVLDATLDDTLTLRVFDPSGQDAINTGVRFDDTRGQDTFHWVHARMDTPWFEDQPDPLGGGQTPDLPPPPDPEPEPPAEPVEPEPVQDPENPGGGQ